MKLFKSCYKKWWLFIGHRKEQSFCHKLKSSDPNIFATGWRKPLIFQTQIILSISINSFKYLRSTTLGYKDTEIRKPAFVAKTELLFNVFNNFYRPVFGPFYILPVTRAGHVPPLPNRFVNGQFQPFTGTERSFC